MKLKNCEIQGELGTGYLFEFETGKSLIVFPKEAREFDKWLKTAPNKSCVKEKK